ncbi:class I SAM-dependent methyltransferase [Actinotalea caeni]|uniref:class I SAM-dependent methyltransferase n=1 Tax=Actinotalea caeni TaxID=1348467 RepID=UPI0013920891|nr:class I SAM-dependent methyltransferase [Actinotalea caeni]
MDPADPLVAERMLAYYAGEMRTRADRPLGAERTARVQAFADALTEADTVLEVGCGAGRDGRVLAAGRGRYLGIDLSPEGVAICRTLGLDARVASATALPVADASVDAVWSMSTLMHLDPAAFEQALAEIARVLRPGGVAAVGVWGHEPALAGFDEHGRFFDRRTDAGLRAALERVGAVEVFETWGHDGGHRYQWALVRRG